MQLISTEDVVKAINLNKFGGAHMAKMIMSVLQIDKVNQLYASNYLKQPTDFLNSVIQDAGINCDIIKEDLAKIPENGPFVIIANHPFGGIEGMILLDCLLSIRPDFKLIANFLFQRITPIKDYVFAVNPFETYKHVQSSFNGLRYAREHLSKGHPLGVFPAGEVSAYQHNQAGITDKVWNTAILKFIKNANVPVIPVYFGGKNSAAFYFMGRIHPLLRTVKLPSEMLNKRNTRIKVSIGDIIPVETQNDYQHIPLYGQFLRSATYSLQSQDILEDPLRVFVKDTSICNLNEPPLLIHEVAAIPAKFILFKWMEYTIYCAPFKVIPNIIKEIARLREITFSEVGEGTNKSLDMDKFDSYYDQLFIWNEAEHEIVGGYRLGKGCEIIPEWGMKGFYTNTLFSYGNKLESIFSQSVELGRSFIVKKYQRKAFSLFLLWKGIFQFLLKNKQYRYLFGPVSISNNYKPLSKQLMIRFIEEHYFNERLASAIIPRSPYHYSQDEKEIPGLPKNVKDLNDLDLLIKEVEGGRLKIPVLLKKYLLIGGEIAGFNMDEEFNNCLDCLLVLDLKKIPADILNAMSREG